MDYRRIMLEWAVVAVPIGAGIVVLRGRRGEPGGAARESGPADIPIRPGGEGVIYVKFSAAPVGTYSIVELNRALIEGKLNSAELAWTVGMKEWRPVREVPGVAPQGPPPLLVAKLAPKAGAGTSEATLPSACDGRQGAPGQQAGPQHGDATKNSGAAKFGELRRRKRFLILWLLYWLICLVVPPAPQVRGVAGACGGGLGIAIIAWLVTVGMKPGVPALLSGISVGAAVYAMGVFGAALR